MHRKIFIVVATVALVLGGVVCAAAGTLAARSAPASEPPLFVWPMNAKHDSTESKAPGRRIIAAFVEMALFWFTTKR